MHRGGTRGWHIHGPLRPSLIMGDRASENSQPRWHHLSSCSWGNCDSTPQRLASWSQGSPRSHWTVSLFLSLKNGASDSHSSWPIKKYSYHLRRECTCHKKGGPTLTNLRL